MQADLSMLDSITRLAQQYGPFLFAILFVLVVTRTAHQYYEESNTRQQPPASEDEKRTYRLYFRSSIWVGIALTLLSIGWWFYVQAQGTNIYQIAIVGLQPEEAVLSQYYVKSVPRPTIPGAATLTDDYFIIAQDQPFRIGDKFVFYYFKTPASPATSAPQAAVGLSGTRIETEYAGNKLDTYQVTQSGNNVTLTMTASNSPASLAADNSAALVPRLASAAATPDPRSDP